MENINTKEYWESRFRSGYWRRFGSRQTTEHAKANVKNMKLPRDFAGSIVDFGCALGDAIPVYSKAFPRAKLRGIDISEHAIEECRKRFNPSVEFSVGDHSVVGQADVIIVNNVMEHLTNDKEVVTELLRRCESLFIFVPFKEDPLYYEHVNFYDEDYYDCFKVVEKKIFTISYKNISPIKPIIKDLLSFRVSFYSIYSIENIMYQIEGTLNGA